MDTLEDYSSKIKASNSGIIDDLPPTGRVARRGLCTRGSARPFPTVVGVVRPL